MVLAEVLQKGLLMPGSLFSFSPFGNRYSSQLVKSEQICLMYSASSSTNQLCFCTCSIMSGCQVFQGQILRSSLLKWVILLSFVFCSGTTPVLLPVLSLPCLWPLRLVTVFLHMRTYVHKATEKHRFLRVQITPNHLGFPFHPCSLAAPFIYILYPIWLNNLLFVLPIFCQALPSLTSGQISLHFCTP